MSDIPKRDLGKTGVKLPLLGMGGHHLGQAPSQQDAVNLVHAALDGGVELFDNCWEYHLGRHKDKRDRVVIATKFSGNLYPGDPNGGGSGRKAIVAQCEQSLRRLQTDHLDLWQVHGVTFDNDPELAYRPGGVIEALEKAKKAGKVRFVGFTGHKDPSIHLDMIRRGYAFDTVQMPLNCFDASFRSFENEVVPEANKRGIACLGMKSLGGTAAMVKKGAVTAEEAIRYAMSLPVTVTICGMESMDRVEQNLAIARGFKAMTPQEMQALRDRCRKPAGDGRFELYKLSLKYDNPQARLNHEFPLDSQQMEVKEMLEGSK